MDVVGRGPSLLELAAGDVRTPVIVLNHAIERARTWGLAGPIYSMQKDGCLVEPQAPEVLLLAKRQSERCFLGYAPRYVVSPVMFGLPQHCMSLTLAVALAGFMGCRAVRLLAFDAYTRADFRTVVGEELQTIGRGYLHAAGQAMRYAERKRIAMEWVA